MTETKIIELLKEIKEEVKAMHKELDTMVSKNEFYKACDEQRHTLRHWEQELKICNFRLNRIEKRFGIP